jgi:hypothetical protein
MIILLDVDDVLLNCSEEVHATAQEFFQTDLLEPAFWTTDVDFPTCMGLTVRQWRDFEAYLRKCDDLATRFKWMPEAFAFTERISTFGDVCFCTAPWVGLKHWYEARRTALEHFLGRRNYHLVMTSSKHLVKGDILIDDRWKNLERTPERGILFAQPANTSDRKKAEHVVYDYTEALTKVAKWQKSQ